MAPKKFFMMGKQDFNCLVPLRPDNVTITKSSDEVTANYSITNSTEPNELEGYIVQLSKWERTEFTLIEEQNNTIGGSGYSDSGFFTSLEKGAAYKISVFSDDVCSSSQLSADSADGYFQAGE